MHTPRVRTRVAPTPSRVKVVATIVMIVLGTCLVVTAPALAGTGSLKWSAPQLVDQVPSGAPQDISCPDATDCFALDGAGNVLSTTQPGGAGRWARVAAGADGMLACPSTTLCVAAGGIDLRTSTTPRAAGRWASIDLEPDEITYLTGLACPTAQLCIAMDDRLRTEVSTNPAGGKSAWQVTTIPGVGGTDESFEPTDLSCSSAQLCVTIDASTNNVLWSTDPAGGGSTWQHSPFPDNGDPTAVDCVTDTLCFAVVGDEVWDSTDPSGGGSTWVQTFGSGTGVPDITHFTCASATSCLALTQGGALYATTNPLGGWSDATAVTQPLPAGSTDDGISCPLVTTCMTYGDGLGGAYADQGGANGDTVAPNTAFLVSPAPSGATPSLTWTNVAVYTSTQAMDAIACPATSLCVATDVLGRVLTSTDPSAARPAWKVVRADTAGDPTQVTCASTHLCLIADGIGQVLSSTAPAAGTWQTKEIDRYDNLDDGPSDGSLSAIACATTTLCWAADPSDGDGGEYGGEWYRSTAPGTDVWSATRAWNLSTDSDGSTEMVTGDAIACASATLCVGTGRNASGRTVETDVWRAGHARPVVVGTFGGSYAACGGPALCVVAGTTKLRASRTPAIASSWHSVTLESDHRQLTALDCPSTGVCVAADTAGRIAVSTTPTGAASSWHFSAMDPGTTITGVSCATAKLCLAVDSAGRVVVGRR